MLKKVKNMMISKAVKVAEVFTKEEKGASDIVVIIVIIAIIFLFLIFIELPPMLLICGF